MDRTTHPITIFLRDHSKYAFTVGEIVKKVKMKEDTVRSMLNRLKQDKLVEHKSPFFAYKVKIIKARKKRYRVR